MHRLFDIAEAPSGCGGPALLGGRRGTVTSLNYPGGGSDTLTCLWIIDLNHEEVKYL